MDDRVQCVLPVFVFPNSLDVVASQAHTHKQIVTLYNPYEFPLNYKVFCTAPKKYSVIEPQGILKGKCCIDIVIRHIAGLTRSNIGVSDKFRFEVSKYRDEDINGRKDVVIRIVESPSEIERRPSLERSSFQGNFSNEGLPRHPPPAQYALSPNVGVQSSSHWLAVAAAAVCIGALMLPTQGDSEPSPLPPYLYLSVPQKLVAAYVLGIVTMLIVRPT